MPETIKRRLQDCGAALASDDGPIFSTVAKLVEAIQAAISVMLLQIEDRVVLHSIKFADTFAHSSVSVTLIKNVSDVPIEAFITRCETSRRDACGLAAWAGNADAALYFVQAIDPGHGLSPRGWPASNVRVRPFFLIVQMQARVRAERSSRASG